VANETNQTDWSVVIEHTVNTLPDGFKHRHALLTALHKVVPTDHPQFPAVKDLLHSLNDHLVGQREFPFSTSTTGGKKP
jgi:hypothetical protein